MSDNQILSTIIEGFMVLAVIFGFIFEDKLVEFEEWIGRKIKGKFCAEQGSSRKAKIVRYEGRSKQRRAAK